ncbi:MAG: NAD(+) synthase [Oscillospiraceae bacterium]|nr:NAD(+) synthase [Oscillospiraceae bacterium]
MLDYIRIACAVPQVKVGDVQKNTQDICTRIAEADQQNVDLLVFPELALTGYTCGDLFFQDTLLTAARKGLREIVDFCASYPAVTVVVGLPVKLGAQLYNCAAVISGGKLRGIVPKTFIPNHGEFGEKRWFASAMDLRITNLDEADFPELTDRENVVVGTDCIFRIGDGTKLAVEICEDLWAPLPPSTQLALGGAEVIVNLAASNETVGKRTFRTDMVKHQSASCICAYAFCSAGATESTQDLVFSGHSVIAQKGKVLAQNEKDIDSDYMLITDVDLGAIRADRGQSATFRDAATAYLAPEDIFCVDCNAKALRSDGSLYPLVKRPFVPEARQARLARCRSIFQMQVAGLKHRLQTIGANAVVGISGGLDSTLALLVSVAAIKQLGRHATDVYGITMPCFGTSDRTYQNSLALMKLLGISSKEINIRNAVNVHFADIGHDPAVHDTTYENAQARERTQILMDFAGRVGGIVIGTGDMSELALGWCTYNGDHMSMYGVNCSIPKTLIRWIIEAVMEEPEFAAAKDVLADILDTPISPELLPPDEQGKISQQTEDIVGPYELHDFYLFYMLRYGFAPAKIYTLACRAFREEFPPATVKKWLLVFYRRFFTQQFKRNCQPDGVKVGSVSVGPRMDLKMPSDASARLWLQEIENL